MGRDGKRLERVQVSSKRIMLRSLVFVLEQNSSVPAASLYFSGSLTGVDGEEGNGREAVRRQSK